MKFKTLIEFMEHFNADDVCRSYFEKMRFKDGEYCPRCGHDKIYRFNDGKRFRCASCKKDFTIKTGTVFGESKIGFRKWFIAIYLLTSTRKGISSVELAEKVGVTQKTAWFMDHRIRNAMSNDDCQLFGTVEADETYIGGKERNRHRSKRRKGRQGRSLDVKTPVMGMYERGGDVKATVLPNLKKYTLERELTKTVGIGSKIYTDEFCSYYRISNLFRHRVVNHSRGEYVNRKDGKIHTNNIESFWALFKRGYCGIYHYMSPKHLQRYADEFTYRFNKRSVAFEEMFFGLIEDITKTEHLSYRRLTDGPKTKTLS